MGYAISLDVDSRHVTMGGTGLASRQVMAALDAITSYKIAGSHFSPAYRDIRNDGSRRWDGKEHLLKYSKTSETYRFPVGLLEDVVACLDDLKVTRTISTVNRRKPTRAEYGWNPAMELRPYQQAAIDAICTPNAVGLEGLGIIQLAIRGGKTRTAAGLIRRLGPGRVVFIVTSKSLLYQTQEALAEALQEDIGIIGDDQWVEQRITVALIGALNAKRGGTQNRVEKVKIEHPVTGEIMVQHNDVTVKVPQDPRYAELAAAADLVIFDECHHLRGAAWHAVIQDFDAPWRVGLSATVFPDSAREFAKGVIWLMACCGKVRIRVSASELIEGGFLMRPEIWLVPVRTAGFQNEGWSQELRERAIYFNVERNVKIIRICKEMKKRGLKTLVSSNRLEHISLLTAGLLKSGLQAVSVVGTDDIGVRRERVKRLVDGDLDVIVGTVFGEGVDIPDVEVVINAEGGKDAKSTIQKMRNLTKAEGKKACIYVDLMDFTNPYFADHSRERLETYQTEQAFKLVRKEF